MTRTENDGGSSKRRWIRSLLAPILLILIAVPCVQARRVAQERELSDDEREYQEQKQQQFVRGHHHHRHLQQLEVPAPTNPNDHLVTNLPLMQQPLSVQHWAGLLPASANGDKFFFYWLFAPDTSASPRRLPLQDADIPLLIWLNGGPGCSSMDGLWLENGPLQLGKGPDDRWSITERAHSWHKAPAYTLYIDQPVGTGLSFTTNQSYPRNDEEVNIDFYYFLLQFLQLHSDKFVDMTPNRSSRPVYFSGESHAGHYIPSMMAYIQQKQQELGSNVVQVHLAGAAIGNGWIDPYHQYAAADAAYGHGLIGLAQKTALEESERKCQQELSNGILRSKTCLDLLDNIVDQSMGASFGYRVSQYDIRFTERSRGRSAFPPGHRDVEAYLGPGPIADTATVLAAIHALPSMHAGQQFKECTNPPWNALAHQDGLGVTQDIVQLLNSGDDAPRLLFFNGVMDLICNHIGNEIALELLEWEGRDNFRMAPRSMWKAHSDTTTPKSSPSGYYKEFGPLSYLKIMNAGHMVPMDVPEVSLEMMQTFLFHGSSSTFSSSPQQLNRAIASNDDSKCSPDALDKHLL